MLIPAQAAACHVCATTPGTNVAVLNPMVGTFQLTSPTFSYNDYAASPVHRFYQMWQQFDCHASHVVPGNPSGCRETFFFRRIAETTHLFQIALRHFRQSIVSDYIRVTADLFHVERGFGHQRRTLGDLENSTPDPAEHR